MLTYIQNLHRQSHPLQKEEEIMERPGAYKERQLKHGLMQALAAGVEKILVGILMGWIILNCAVSFLDALRD